MGVPILRPVRTIRSYDERILYPLLAGVVVHQALPFIRQGLTGTIGSSSHDTATG